MYVLIDIIILIYHQEAWSRLAKESSIPTEPPVGKKTVSQLNPVWGKEIQKEKGGQMLSLTVALMTYRKRINTLHLLAILRTSYAHILGLSQHIILRG